MKPDLVASYGGFILHITFFLSRSFFFFFFFFFLKERYQHQWSKRKPGMAEVRCLCGHLSGVLFLKKACCLLNSLYSVLCQRVLSEEMCSPELILTSRDVVVTAEMNKPLWESDPFPPNLWWHVSHGHEALGREILKGDMSTWTKKIFLIKKLMKEQRNSIEKEKEIQEKRHTLKKKKN